MSPATSELLTYDKWRFLYPPRPTTAIAPATLNVYQNRGWICEIKKNGTCTVLGLSPDKKIYPFTRHAEMHSAWKPDLDSPCLRKLKDLPNEWFVFAGEILHSKGNGIRDTFYIFDILVADSKQLVGTTKISRTDLLYSMFKTEPGPRGYDFVDERLWLAKPLITESFEDVYNNLPFVEDEGVVLKNPMAKLGFCFSEGSNSNWNVKCRHRTKNFHC
jgi:hypothetical protein